MQNKDVSVVKMTPALAAKLLEHRGHTRNVTTYRVDAHAKAMKEGRWIDESSAPIVIGMDGNLQNGQHRLLATINANYTWTAVLIKNAPLDARLYHDTGKKRSFSDLLKMMAVADAAKIAALTRLMWFWDNGLMETRSDYTQARIVLNPDHGDLLAYYNEHKEELMSGRRYERVSRRTQLTRSAVSALVILFNRLDEDECDDFMNQIGLVTQPSEQVTALLRALDNADATSRRLDTQHQMALVIKTWNLWRDGASVRQNIRWRSGGSAPEKMPEPR